MTNLNYECECKYESHYFPDEWDEEWTKLSHEVPETMRFFYEILAKDCDGGFPHKVIKETEHFKLVKEL